MNWFYDAMTLFSIRFSAKSMTKYGAYAVVDIDIEEVKNDMVRSVVIESAITLSPVDQYRGWFEATLGELEEM